VSSASEHVTLACLPAYGSDIEEDITADTSGHFKKMLIVLLQVSSPEGRMTSPERDRVPRPLTGPLTDGTFN